MREADIIIATTWDASTSYIPIASNEIPIADVPTTQYLQGGGGLLKVSVRKSKANGVQINKQAVKYNVLKLRYRALGDLVR